MKRTLLLFIGVWIALTIQAAATSGSCGTNATWEFDELHDLLSIEGTGAMKDYKSYSLPPWHQYKDDIKTIYIEEGITELGQYAFWECENVEYVDIPLSLERIGMNAFAHCKKLDDVVVYNNLTTIEGQAFLFCENLTSFIVPYSVTNFGSGIFQGCKILSNIVLPKNLKSIPYHTFYNCWALTQVDIPSSVESIGEAAFFNSGITSIQLPSNLIKIETWAFKGCDDIISLVVPDKVTEIGTEFVQDCNSLQTVTIGQSVSKIGYNAFQSCDVLSKVIFKPTTPPTLNMTNNFKDVPSSIKIVVPCGSLSAYQTAYASQKGISSSNFEEDCGGNLPADGSILTCSDAAYYASQLEHNSPTTQTYTIYGYITETNGVVSYNQQTFWMADTKNGGKVFEIYWGNVSEQLQVGDYVKCQGHLMRFYETSEMKNPNVTLVSRDQPITYTPNWVEIRYYPEYGFHSLDMFVVDNNDATQQLLRILFYPDELHKVDGFYSSLGGNIQINPDFDGYYMAANNTWYNLSSAAFMIDYRKTKSNGDKVYYIYGYCYLENGDEIDFTYENVVTPVTVNIVNGEWQYSNYNLDDIAEAIEMVNENKDSQKILKDGHIYILRGDHIYDTQGKMVR